MNSHQQISAVDLHLNGMFLISFRVCTVYVDLEPSISRPTVHSRQRIPARDFKPRRAWFNAGRWIRDQRPTLTALARARARCARLLGPFDVKSTAHNRPRRIEFSNSREVYLQTEKGIKLWKFITIYF